MDFASAAFQRALELKEPRGKQGVACWANATDARTKIIKKDRIPCILTIVKGPYLFFDTGDQDIGWSAALLTSLVRS
jgi:hypothetical protein